MRFLLIVAIHHDDFNLTLLYYRARQHARIVRRERTRSLVQGLVVIATPVATPRTRVRQSALIVPK